ncbi:helix-turn-helix domain-containing protein [Marinomonas transparens]|uniref:Helix-turn-helix transcriptional regulator n=1 Tax=Marinomonas transparens TaxID=2795388 RepID=A0A934JWY9_9GAMM|nr:helix-turn-helix transcriptional regulator [Marinomonas transparens]MBJ7539916.1 helix-turn-helix transcriptional regulator [Marinomonas transparens]
MRNIAKEVGELILSQRKARNLSQEALAAKSKIDRSYMGRIERGEVNVTLKALWDIAASMGISVKLLIPD